MKIFIYVDGTLTVKWNICSLGVTVKEIKQNSTRVTITVLDIFLDYQIFQAKGQSPNMLARGRISNDLACVNCIQLLRS